MGGSVIVVDDDAAVRNSLKFCLELEGFDVRVYEGGKELLADAGLSSASCLVIDQYMPGMTGVELVDRLRERYVDVPAILITAKASDELRRRAALSGVRQVLEKPLEDCGLFEGIRSAIASPRAPRDTAISQDRQLPMSKLGAEAFDSTLQTTHMWLDELMQEIGPYPRVAWQVLGVVLRAIRDRLPLSSAVHLGTQLPILVRGAYYDQWHPPDAFSEATAREDFVDELRSELAGIRTAGILTCTRAVFGVLSRHLDKAQIEKIRTALPERVRVIWSDAETPNFLHVPSQIVQTRDTQPADDAVSRPYSPPL
jgi:uncharacterized protein (DUF2267 family)/DNA-binding NarL/FixJ family response regulator